jgi:hypothetical protein
MTTEEVLSKMQSIASGIEDPIRRMRMEKQIAMVGLTFDAANKITEQIKQIPSSKKKLFKGYDRRPRKKQKTSQIISRIYHEAYMTSIRLNMIAATPIPNYTKGSDFVQGGFAPFFKNEPELVKIPQSFITAQTGAAALGMSVEEMYMRVKPESQLFFERQATNQKINDSFIKMDTENMISREMTAEQHEALKELSRNIGWKIKK